MPRAPERFAERLFQATRAWRNEMDRRLRPLGLSRSKWTLLVSLARGGAGLTQTALAQRLGIEGPTLTGLLDRLERDGLVERRRADGDRRAKVVHLSGRGKALIGKIRTIAAGLRRDLVAELDAAELQTALRVLEHVKAKAESLP